MRRAGAVENGSLFDALKAARLISKSRANLAASSASSGVTMRAELT